MLELKSNQLSLHSFLDASGKSGKVYFYQNGRYMREKENNQSGSLKLSEHQVTLGNVWSLELSAIYNRQCMEFKSVSLLVLKLEFTYICLIFEAPYKILFLN